MQDSEIDHFGVQQMTRRQLARRVDYTKNMFFAAAAASLAIVGAGAYVVGLWL